MFAKSVIRPVLLALGALSLSGCMAEVRSEPAYAEVDYPYTDCGGETAYSVGDRWHYQHRPHWVHYRHEPPGRTRYRARTEHAPRGWRWEHWERAARPAPRHQYYEHAARRAPKREYHERGATRRYDAPRSYARGRSRRYRD